MELCIQMGISFSPLPFTYLLCPVISEASSDNHFALLHFFFLGIVLVTASCAVLQTYINSSSGTVSIRSNSLNLFASIWNECNCTVVWPFFGITLHWDWNEKWPFPILWPLLSFPNLLTYQVYKLESRFLGDLPTNSDMQMILHCHYNFRKWRGTKEPLDEGERGEWKSWLEIQH